LILCPETGFGALATNSASATEPAGLPGAEPKAGSTSLRMGLEGGISGRALASWSMRKYSGAMNGAEPRRGVLVCRSGEGLRKGRWHVGQSE